MPGRLLPSDDGWWEWLDEPPQVGSVFAQLDEADDGRLHVMALHVEGEAPVSAELLRSIPIGRIEALANALLHPHAVDRGWRKVARLPDDLLHAAPRNRPDEFYAAVASTYRHLVSETPQPVRELAEANGVPKTTAHRWVKEARRRGMLAPGRRGKAG